MLCNRCKHQVSLWDKKCLKCGHDLGFLNVRFAERSDETKALTDRFNAARANAVKDGREGVFDFFCRCVDGAHVLMGRNIKVVDSFASDKNYIFTSFYKQISGGRLIEDNMFDPYRSVAEGAVNPYFYDQLIYGLASLNYVGDPYYGSYFITLNDSAVSHRTTFFEENTFTFCMKKSVIAGTSPPLGFRSVWGEKGKLAGAKLGGRLQPHMTEVDFPEVLVSPASSGVDPDCIEAHIYGDIHVEAIEKVVATGGRSPEDQIIWESAKRKFIKRGITVEER